MNPIPVDYNAAIETEALRLGFADTQQTIVTLGVDAGDWVWVSDGEVLVGAHLEIDEAYGLVAMPRWQTVVNLDDYVEVDWPSFMKQLVQVLQKPDRSRVEETKLFQLLTVFDQLAPAELKVGLEPGYFTFRAAGALRDLGELELSFTLLEQALAERPSYPPFIFTYLDHLGQINPARAVAEATARAQDLNTNAVVLAACINVLSTATDRLDDAEFEQTVSPILGWIDRFDQAPGRGQVRPAVLALVQFNQGSLLLRLGRNQEAKAAFDRAHATDPSEPTIDQARALESYDETARDLAARYRHKPIPIAA